MSPDHQAGLRSKWPFDLNLDQHQYTQRLLESYRKTPTVAGYVRPADRLLAAQLYQRGVPLALVEAAFSLAAVRRIFRDPRLGVLNPIRSLHYFLPVLDELLRSPPDPGYIQCLDGKLKTSTSTPAGAARQSPEGRSLSPEPDPTRLRRG